MNVSIISFTNKGQKLAGRIAKCLREADYEATAYHKKPVYEWTEKQFIKKNAIIFVGATGIAVRAIAPWVKDKLTDPPVLVVDELGHYVIPILSGHIGGANELAKEVSQMINATPVITTATDINMKFAIDVFAKKNNFVIANREGIAAVSSKQLSGEVITLYASKKHLDKKRVPDGVVYTDNPEMADVIIAPDHEIKECNALLLLRPRIYVIGIGCKKGKNYEDIDYFIKNNLKSAGIELSSVCAITSIDVKEHEKGLVDFAHANEIPFITFDKNELAQTEGEFDASEFVLQNVGVDNVCERAAIHGAGEGAYLLQHKIAYEGMTMAIGVRNWHAVFYNGD